LGCIPVVVGAPTANFSASTTTVAVGGSIDFTDLSSGSPTSWDWTFTGGTPGTSSVQNPTNITYNTAGTYTVTLTVTNVSGTDTETKTSYITVTPLGGGGCDTITNFPLTGTPTILLSGGPGGVGYVTGHNNYLDKAKADLFSQVQPPNAQITNALIGFGVATNANTTNTFNVTIWDDNGAAGAPGTELGTTTVTYATAAADVAGGQLTAVTFAPPVNVTGPYYLGVEFTYANVGDTIAIIQTADGEVNPGTSWEQFSTNDWHAFSESPTSWGINVAMLIIPIVCEGTGVNDIVQNGISIFPNPTNGQLTIHNSNTNIGTAEMKVVNVMGQSVMTQNYSDFSGTHFVDMSELSNGLYFIEINSGDSKTVHRIMLNK
jgi:PKD repeat protein